MNSSSQLIQGVLLQLAYVGSDYHGFTPQTGLPTVMGQLHYALSKLDPHPSSLRGVSRTDAGVHARGQLVAFDSTREISPRGWVLGLSRHLPDSIAPCTATIVPVGFEPRRHVLRKWYRYCLLRSRCRDPFFCATSWRIGGAFDLDLARKEASTIVGKHDFAAFRSAADQRPTTIRTIEKITIEEGPDPRLVQIDVWGDGFLHHMVRIIAGTLADVARGKLAPGTFHRALRSLDRKHLGVTAPAQGLCLQHIALDLDLKPWPSWPDSPCATSFDRQGE
jgi:tRNA pseudouridine38-40 synthase